MPESNRFWVVLTAHSADAADLCLRVGLDPNILQAAITLQAQRNPSPISAAVKIPQRQQSTASEVRFQHKPTVAANPQRRNKARATRPPTRRLLFPPSALTNTILVIDLMNTPAGKKRKADVLEDPEDPEDPEDGEGPEECVIEDVKTVFSLAKDLGVTETVGR
jgi:hypothetical protein